MLREDGYDGLHIGFFGCREEMPAPITVVRIIFTHFIFPFFSLYKFKPLFLALCTTIYLFWCPPQISFLSVKRYPPVSYLCVYIFPFSLLLRAAVNRDFSAAFQCGCQASLYLLPTVGMTSSFYSAANGTRAHGALLSEARYVHKRDEKHRDTETGGRDEGRRGIKKRKDGAGRKV